VTGRARTSDFGNPFIGIYGVCNEQLLLIGTPTSQKFEDACTRALGIEAKRMSVDCSGLLGVYCTLNSNGILLPAYAEKSEVAQFKKLGLNVHKVKGGMTACGNNVLANDKGAIANPRLPKKEVKQMSDCLGVEVVQTMIANYGTVGALCIATNTGFLAHTRANMADMALLKEVLKVPGSIGTANFGVPFVGLCALANSKGYVVGTETTGFEMGRFDEALDFID